MVQQVEHDLFVSYAHERDPKWVRALVEELKNRVEALLGSSPSVFFDERMEQGENVPRVLLDAVGASRLLLVILTPRYLNSAWCRMELSTFREPGADVVANRIFVVEAEYIDREQQWPPELADIFTMKLWKQKPNTDIYQRIEPGLQLFKQKVVEIAHGISKSLKAAADDDFCEPKYVWIAEPTDDLASEWDELAAAVRQCGWRVLPASSYPRHSLGAYTESLRRHLSLATVYVQLFGPGPGRGPSWGGAQFPILQAAEARTAVQKCAAAVSAHKRAAPIRWLRWRKSSPGPDDTSDYAALLREGEVQESSFGEFKAEVIRCLNAGGGPEIPAVTAALPPVDPAAAVELYVHSDEVDRPLAEEIMRTLAPLNVYCMGTPRLKAGQSPQAIRAEQQQAVLAGCHGVILVYGSTPAGWVGANFSMLRKAFAMVRPRGAIGVLNGPPPDLPRIEITGPVVVAIDCTQGLNPALLAGFVDRVRQTLSDADRV
jgi:TIR domain